MNDETRRIAEKIVAQMNKLLAPFTEVLNRVGMINAAYNKQFATIQNALRASGGFANLAEITANLRLFNLPQINLPTIAFNDSVMQEAMRGLTLGNAYLRIWQEVNPVSAQIANALAGMSSYRSILAGIGNASAAAFNNPAMLHAAVDALSSIDVEALQAAAVEDVEQATNTELTPADADAAGAILTDAEFSRLPLNEQITELYRLATSKAPAKPWVKAILIWVFLQLASAVVKDCWHAIPDTVSQSVKPAKLYRQIRRVITSYSISESELRHYRIVARCNLDARGGYWKHAQLVANLPGGATVRIIKRRKRWGLVEWIENDTGEVIRAWVRHKYLRKVIRRHSR